jgi:uncharacterized protein (DUF4415 family)
MKKTTSNNLTHTQKAEIDALAALSAEQIDITDAPELKDWSEKKRGLFYRPIKQQITLRIDADLIAWFKSKVPNKGGYQTDINRALREYVMQHKTEG